MSDDNPRLITLKNVILSFTDSLKTAKPTVKDGVPKHGCNILVPPDEPDTAANKAKVLKALEVCGEQEWKKPEMYKTIAEDDPKRVGWRKGERFKNAEGEIYKGYAGAMVIPASGPGGNKNPRRPVILDRNIQPIWNPDKGFELVNRIPEVCYSGVRADVKVEYYPVSGADRGGNGIFPAVQVIRSYQEGERMSGGYQYTDEEADDFDELPPQAGASSAASDDDFG